MEAMHVEVSQNIYGIVADFRRDCARESPFPKGNAK